MIVNCTAIKMGFTYLQNHFDFMKGMDFFIFDDFGISEDTIIVKINFCNYITKKI